MTEKRQLQEVFKTVGLPPYTYVKPEYYGEVKGDVLQEGRHLLIEGPSGIGKTCVVFKVFEELAWDKGTDFGYVSCRDLGAIDAISDFLKTALSGDPMRMRRLVIDDFHLLSKDTRAEIGSNLKRLSDQAFEKPDPPKVILIGIPTTEASLLTDALDLGPRLGAYRFKRATDLEIDRLIDEGENALKVLFEDSSALLAESDGNFWLAQYICNKICAINGIYVEQDEPAIVTFDLLSIRQRLMTELSQKYMPTARTMAKGKKWRPGGNKPYLEVLLALSRIPESVVTFDKLLVLVPENRKAGIKAIRSRIDEVIHDEAKGVDLRQQLAFDPDSGFSIEDPLFRYFLSNLDEAELLADLGIDPSTMAAARIYSYDIGFSFAGEVRAIVEAVNSELKSEDVVTFYDFDQQAVLLGLDLQKTLTKIYSESCRYYLVFMDANYREKVWTRFEQDILTHGGRTGHIIPVVLDEVGEAGLVGIPSTIARINLRSAWGELSTKGTLSTDARNTLRNRCILPMLEKLTEAPSLGAQGSETLRTSR